MAKLDFGSEKWVKSLQEHLNASEPYTDAAKNWEGDFYFVVEPEGSLKEPIYMYMDLWHGQCRDAKLVVDPGTRQPAFVMSGTYGKWKKVVTAQIDPIQALVTGQIKLKGNLVMVMKHVKAAQEMVKACTRIDTEFAI